jgi:hypothetical protein
VQVGGLGTTNGTADYNETDRAKQTANNTVEDSTVTGMPVEYHGGSKPNHEILTAVCLISSFLFVFVVGVFAR